MPKGRRRPAPYAWLGSLLPVANALLHVPPEYFITDTVHALVVYVMKMKTTESVLSSGMLESTYMDTVLL